MVEEFEVILAKIEDMRDVFDLSNDYEVRKNSFNPEKINWKEHQNWFKNKLKDENCFFYVIKKDDKFIAQVRFDKVNYKEYDISISISNSFRGKGYGTKILKSSSQKILFEHNVKKINAYIKNENKISQKIFEKAGYVLKNKNKNKMRFQYNAE